MGRAKVWTAAGGAGGGCTALLQGILGRLKVVVVVEASLGGTTGDAVCVMTGRGGRLRGNLALQGEGLGGEGGASGDGHGQQRSGELRHEVLGVAQPCRASAAVIGRRRGHGGGRANETLV